MKTIKKVSVTPVQSYTGQIIDSMTTSSSKTTNAPSINAVENFVNDKMYTMDREDFSFTAGGKTWYATVIRWGLMVSLYFDFDLQSGESIGINTVAIPEGYRPLKKVNFSYGYFSSSSNYIQLEIDTDGTLTGWINGNDNQSGSYERSRPFCTYSLGNG